MRVVTGSVMPSRACTAHARTAPCRTHARAAHARTSHHQPTRRVCCAAAESDPLPLPDVPGNGENPLELLRVTKDHAKRSALLQQLDSTWSDWETKYRPTPVEDCLVRELGISQQAAMMAALQAPGLVQFDVEEQLLPTIRVLKQALLEPQAIFFLLTRSSRHLIGLPQGALQRWTDFLQVYGMSPRDLLNFLQRATPTMLEQTTLYSAGRVAQWLRASIGLTDDYLATRILPIYPQILARDVEGELAPITAWLMGLGLSAQEVAGVVRSWPEVLLCSSEGRGQLVAFRDFLINTAGCSVAQVADMVRACPHLIGLDPKEIFGTRLADLQAAGLDGGDVKAMLGSGGPAFLACSGGVADQLGWLKDKGLSGEEVRQLLLARPQVLCEKVHELERKWAFIANSLLPHAAAAAVAAAAAAGGPAAASASSPAPSPPQPFPAPASSSVPALPNAQPYIAPQEPSGPDRILLSSVSPKRTISQQPDTSTAIPDTPTPSSTPTASAASSRPGPLPPASSSAVRAQILAAPALLSEPLGLVIGPRVTFALSRPAVASRFSPLGDGLDYNLLLALPDAEWVSVAGISANEYNGHRIMFEEQYDAQLYAENAAEFQQELKKLGIYEGS